MHPLLKTKDTQGGYLHYAMLPIQDLQPLLQTPKKIFITTHHKPDGDAIGSMMGLYHYLVKKGHLVTPVAPSEIPDFLMWIPGIEHALNYEAESKRVETALAEAEIVYLSLIHI